MFFDIIHRYKQRCLLREYCKRRDLIIESAKYGDVLFFGETKKKFSELIKKRLHNLKEYYIMFKKLDVNLINENR